MLVIAETTTPHRGDAFPPFFDLRAFFDRLWGRERESFLAKLGDSSSAEPTKEGLCDVKRRCAFSQK